MRDRDSILLENAYLKVINEIASEYVDNVKNAIADKELPFNDIFGNKLRLKLPIKGTDTYSQIINQISKIKNFDHFDPQKKEVVKKIKVDPKYGGGEKFQRINLGRAISLLDLPEDQKKKMLDWFANYSTNIPEMEDTNKYTVVLSRAPIDVLRMGELYSGIKSCHAQGGQYFHCAIAEAKEGGPIAFVVKTKDLSSLSEEEFQFDEIFADAERDVKGIDPISRLRVRRYVNNETGENLGVPETRIYGKSMAGFYNTVKDFLKEKQSQEGGVDEISAEFKARKLTRTGGSYSDSSDSHLFNQMFDTNTFYGSLPHESNESDESRVDQFVTELSNMKNRFTFEWFDVNYDVEESDDNYVYYYGSGYMKLNLKDLTVELSDDFFTCLNNAQEHYDFERFKRYNPIGKYDWEKVKPYGIDDETLVLKFKKFLTKFEEYDPTDFVQYGLSHIYVPYRDRNNPTERNTSLSFICCFGDDCGGTEDNTDKYLDFLYEVKKYDEKAEEIIKAFTKAIKVSGFAKSFDSSNIKDEDDLAEELQNFETDEYGEIELKKEIGSYPFRKTLYQNPSFERKAIDKFNEAYPFFLQRYINEHYKPKSQESPSQLKFKGFMESVKKDKILSQYGIDEVKATFFADTKGFDIPKEGDQTKISISITIKYDVLSSELYGVIMFLDTHIDDLINAAKYYILNQLYGYKSQYNDNLKKVFSKYFLGVTPFSP
jgi:hypothetical protein